MTMLDWAGVKQYDKFWKVQDKSLKSDNNSSQENRSYELRPSTVGRIWDETQKWGQHFQPKTKSGRPAGFVPAHSWQMAENCLERMDWPNFNLVFRSQLSPSIMYPLRQREVENTTVLGWREIEMMKVTSRPAGEQLVMTISILYITEIPALSSTSKTRFQGSNLALGSRWQSTRNNDQEYRNIPWWKHGARIPSFCGSISHEAMTKLKVTT